MCMLDTAGQKEIFATLTKNNIQYSHYLEQILFATSRTLKSYPLFLPEVSYKWYLNNIKILQLVILIVFSGFVPCLPFLVTSHQGIDVDIYGIKQHVLTDLSLPLRIRINGIN